MYQFNTEQLKQTILNFINANTWDEAKRIVEQHPELLTNEADHLLQYLAKIQEGPQFQIIIEDERALLRRCREIGIEAAFDEKLSGAKIPSQFQVDIHKVQRARQRYFDTQNITDLNEAITAWETILEQPAFSHTPQPFKLDVLNNAAAAYWDRYKVRGQLVDLERVLELLQQVVEEITPDSPSKSDYLSNLGLALSEKYKHTSASADLEEAIKLAQKAVDLTLSEQTYSTRPRHLSNLGRVLSERYEQTGELADLDKAIQVTQEAVDLTADNPNYPGRATMLNNLGSYLGSRYSRIGALADLEIAIKIIEQAVDMTPDQPNTLNNLGTWLSERFKRTGQVDDLRRAIEVTHKAVVLTPAEAPTRTSFINDLGNRLGELYEQTRALDDLNKAIEVNQLAVYLAPNQPQYLNNLGVNFSERYHRLGVLADLDKAIEVTQQAIDLTPPNSPLRPAHLNNLGNRLQEGGHFVAAKQAYQEACEEGLSLALDKVVGTSRNWGNLALKQHEWSEAIKAYGYGLEAFDRLYRLQPKREWKESWLRVVQGHHAQAAYADIRSGMLAEAVTTLEYGRAFLLSETLELERSDLDRLAASGYADLHQRYICCLNQLFVLGNRAQVEIGRLQSVHVELDKVIAQIQQIPGYEDFFRPPMFEKDILEAIEADIRRVAIGST